MFKQKNNKSAAAGTMADKMEKIVSLCKRRGFVYPACEIYGGLANAYSYGHYGAELKKNIKDLWWKKFVHEKDNMVGLDGPILLHPKLWEASGHIFGFNDAMVDCRACKKRFRADHLVKELTGEDLEGNLEAMNKALVGKKCPECKKSDWTEARFLNMMFKTEMNGVNSDIYLRPETAGAIFIDFKNILDSMRVKIPFGVGQIGKAFRNEIVARNFIFRVREFEQMEIEYFINPEEKWEPIFDAWLEEQKNFAKMLGIKDDEIQTYEHPKEKLSHYSKKTIDIEYAFPFGMSELCGLAHRGDFDLSAHAQCSGEKLEYFDAEKNKRYIPHVIEPTFGLERSMLAAICSAYTEEKNDQEIRTVLKFPSAIAPIKIAVFPLLKNKPALVDKAREIYEILKKNWVCEFDDNGNVGKRYRRQDEIGTPYCITVDFDTIEKNSTAEGTVTVRDRDTMEQQRIKIEELKEYFAKKLN